MFALRLLEVVKQTLVEKQYDGRCRWFVSSGERQTLQMSFSCKSKTIWGKDISLSLLCREADIAEVPC